VLTTAVVWVAAVVWVGALVWVVALVRVVPPVGLVVLVNGVLLGLVVLDNGVLVPLVPGLDRGGLGEGVVVLGIFEEEAGIALDVATLGDLLMLPPPLPPTPHVPSELHVWPAWQ